VAKELVPDETALRDDPKRIAFDELVRELQARDPSCQAAAETVRASRTRSSYRLEDGLLLFKDRLVVPPQGTLRRVLLERHHDDPRAGHGGIGRTLELLKRHFHWEGIADDVAKYIAECSTCQGNRVPRHKPYGKLKSLPLPPGPWEEISMDFITGLPPSVGLDDRTYDAILVIVDRYTKMSLFIPTIKDVNAAQLARVFDDQVSNRFGMPRGIVSDRDKLFTSQFWSDFCLSLGTTRRLSTAFHPQTDGQTERTNQFVIGWLRNYMVRFPNVWSRELR